MTRPLVIALVLSLATALVLSLGGSCSPPAGGAGGGSGTGNGADGGNGTDDGAGADDNGATQDEVTSFSLPLAEELGSFELQGGVPASNAVAFSIPLPMGPMQYDEITVDVGATLAGVAVVPAGGTTGKGRVALQGPVQAETTWCVGPMESPDAACEMGDTYGPYMVTLDENMQPIGVDVGEISLLPGSVALINSGQFALLIRLLAGIDASVDLSRLDVGLHRRTFEPPAGDCGEPAEMAGTWVGTYTCNSTCGEDFGGDIRLTITQDGTNATYTDGEASYEGTVCGNVFTFDGGVEGEYDESGQLTLQPDGSMTKESSYVGVGTSECGGDCMDMLRREE